jgi:hypothetical protein
MKAFRRQKAIIVVVAIAFVVALTLFAFGPLEQRSSVCQYCGRGHYETWRLGIKTWDKVVERESSAWVDTIHPDHSQHIWGWTSTYHRRWFGRNSVGCGGIDTVGQLFSVRDKIGDAKARELLARYHEIVHLGMSDKRDFILNEINPLLTNLEVKVESP